MSLSTSQKMFRKAAFLTVALVLVLIIANGLVKFASPTGKKTYNPRVVARDRNVVIYNEEEKDPIKKKIAGLWHCEGVVNVEIPCVVVTDHFELKDNGIFWRVKHNTIHLPNQDSAIFTHIMTGYMNPFSTLKTDRDSIAFEVHIIGQIMIHGADTCYAEPGLDTVWNAFATGKQFRIDNTTYSMYDTANGALQKFFPHGATKLVNDIRIQACKAEYSLQTIARNKIQEQLKGVTVESRSGKDISAIIDNYYKGLAFLPIARWESYNGKGSMTLSITVSPNGTVESVAFLKTKPKNIKLEKNIETEVKTWIFPKCSKNIPAITDTCNFVY